MRMKKNVLFVFCISYFTSSAQWQQTNGPYGGMMNCFAVSGTNIFAGSNNNGVFFSSNNGALWTPVNNGLTSKGISSLSVCGTTVFANTWYGIFSSVNNGSQWTAVTGLPGSYVSVMAASPTTIFAATDSGLYSSLDCGGSWALTGWTGTPDRIFICGTTIFAGTSVGNYDPVDSLYISTDNGNSWSTSPLIITDVSGIVACGTNIFAGTQNGMFMSTDNGITWTPINTGLTDHHILSLASTGTSVFAGTSYGRVFVSNNNGSNWTAVGTGLPNYPIFYPIYGLAASGTNIFAPTGSGIFSLSNNGLYWSPSNDGIVCTVIRPHTLAANATTIFAGTMYEGAFVSFDNGNQWAQVNTGLPRTGVRPLLCKGNIVFAGSDSGGIYRSTNNGTNWTYSGLQSDGVACMDTNSTTIFVGTGSGVSLSTDNGATWIQTGLSLGIGYVQSIAVSGTTIFAGTGSGLTVSTDNGVTWSPPKLPNKQVRALVVNGGTVFAAADGFIYSSTDNGTNWTLNLTCNDCCSMIKSGSNIIASSQSAGTVCVTTDNGISWSMINTGLPMFGKSALAASGTNIFLGTWNNGVWTRALSEFINMSTNEKNDIHYQVKIYPNPSTGEINLVFGNSQHGMVNIYNTQGEKIFEQTVNHKQETVNLSPQSKGIYFLEIISEGKREMRKIVLD